LGFVKTDVAPVVPSVSFASVHVPEIESVHPPDPPMTVSPV
jgi:hypothetical protein